MGDKILPSASCEHEWGSRLVVSQHKYLIAGQVCRACGQEIDRRDPEELLCSCNISIWPSEQYNIKVQQRTFDFADLQERAVLRVIASRSRTISRSHMRDPLVCPAVPVRQDFSVQEMRACARITCGRMFRPPRTNPCASHCCRPCRYGYEVHDDRCKRRCRDVQALQNVMPVSGYNDGALLRA